MVRSAAVLAIIGLGFGVSYTSIAEKGLAQHTRKFSELRAAEVEGLFAGKISSNTVIEFVSGDRLPIGLTWKGDIFTLEGDQGRPALVVQTPFFLKGQGSQEPLVSFDGELYKPFAEAFTGSLGASVGGTEVEGGAATAITLSGELNRRP